MAKTATITTIFKAGAIPTSKSKATKTGSKENTVTRSHTKKAAEKKSTPTTRGKKKMTKAETKKTATKTAMKMSALSDAKKLQRMPITLHSLLGEEATHAISGALNVLLADVFALFVKTKNFHWHVSGPHFRDYHLMFDDHADQLYNMIDGIAERVRKIGGTTIRSIGNIGQLQNIFDNNADYVEPEDMLKELYGDNGALIAYMREIHSVCDKYNDNATSGLLDGWIDEADQRAWFLFETSRRSDSTGH